MKKKGRKFVPPVIEGACYCPNPEVFNGICKKCNGTYPETQETKPVK